MVMNKHLQPEIKENSMILGGIVVPSKVTLNPKIISNFKKTRNEGFY
jgi:hypothetical protein